MTMAAEKAFPAYGNLPKSWTRRRLRFDVHLNPKKSSLDMEPGELVSFVPMDAVGEYGGLNLDEVRELEEVYNGYTYFADGDLCIAKITPCFENGKGGLAEGLTNGVGFGTTELHVVRAGPSIDRRFLFYVSIADDFRKLGESEMYGAGGQKRIDESFIKDWMPPLPPLDTQRRIARFLDEKTARIDGLIEKKRVLLARLAEKRQALITRAVTKGLNPDAPLKPSGIDWLRDIPAHWEVKRLKYISPKVTVGIVVTPAAYYSDEGVLAIRGLNVRPMDFDFTDSRNISEEGHELHLKSELHEGDLVSVRTGDPGTTSVITPDLAGTNCVDLVIIRKPRNAFSRFLGWFLNSDAAKVQYAIGSEGALQLHFNVETSKEVTVAFPPSEEQTAIADYIDSGLEYENDRATKVERSVEFLDEYRGALVTAAVTGQIAGLK